MSDASLPPIDVRTFWQVVGLRPSAAAIVTAEADDGPRGFLALSTTHLSADPPLLMVTVDQKTSALKTLLEARAFAFNYLADGQAVLADVFGGRGDLKGADRFRFGHWTTGALGTPLLTGAAASIELSLEDSIIRANAVIIIGRVRNFHQDGTANGLVYWQGRYRSMARQG